MGRAGKETEFDRIYSQTCRRIYSAAVAGARTFSDAEDIFQETYVELLGALKKGRQINEPAAYLMTILRRRLSEHYRGAARQQEIADIVMGYGSDEPTDDLDIEESCITEQLYEEMISLLKAKDEVTQQIFYLYYRLDRSLPETAAELDLPLSTVKSKLYRALKELRKHYREVSE